MFVLARFKDIIRVPASELGRPIEEILAVELNNRFANKVVLNVGLVICLHELSKVGESYIYCGDGAIHTRCEYQMVVFRPRIGEILCGTLKGSSREGLTISLGFFDSILIPAEQMNEPSHFNEPTQTWTWNYEDDGEVHAMSLDLGEQVRFRVHAEHFVDISPVGPPDQAASVQKVAANQSPYKIIGSIAESGLGLIRWWL